MSDSDFFGKAYATPGVAAISPHLLEVAACPSCRAKLAIDYEAATLVCTNQACGLIYPVRDGIPILLVEEARRPSKKAATGDDSDL